MCECALNQAWPQPQLLRQHNLKGLAPEEYLVRNGTLGMESHDDYGSSSAAD